VKAKWFKMLMNKKQNPFVLISQYTMYCVIKNTWHVTILYHIWLLQVCTWKRRLARVKRWME